MRLARFGSRLVVDHLFCPISCMVWFPVRLARYSISLWCLVRLARFGSRLVDNHLSCPNICMVWFCLTCSLGFGLIPHAMLSSRDASATSVPRKSGMSCPVDLPIVSVIDASYVTASWVVGVVNAGRQGLECDCCDTWEHEGF